MDIILHMTNHQLQTLTLTEINLVMKAAIFVFLILISITQTEAQTESQKKSNLQNPLQKVTISADHMHLSLESGKSVYTGNVKITQGDLVLTGDKVTLEQNNDEVERMTVIGKPARYNHVTEKGEPIQAQSEHMVYIASQNKLIMTRNASLKQNDHHVSSQSISYDTVKGVIIAGNSIPDSDRSGAYSSNASNNRQRVNITLTPNKPINLNHQPPADKSSKE